MKQYVIILSRTFPKWHPRAGEPTYFKEQVEIALGKYAAVQILDENGRYIEAILNPKYHTLRGNYERREKIFEQIDRGEACLVLKQWSGVPYRSKQETIAVLTKEDGIGLQKLTLDPSLECCGTVPSNTWIPRGVPEPTLAKYDGLSYEDWKSWFWNCDFSKPFALIQFTKKRY